MCVFLISPVPIAEPLTSELIDTPVFYNLAPRPIKYRVSVPIPNKYTSACVCLRKLLFIYDIIYINVHIFKIYAVCVSINIHSTHTYIT